MTVLSEAMIYIIIANKQKNIGKIEALRSETDERYGGLIYNYLYRIKSNGLKDEKNWLVFSKTSKNVYTS